MPCKNTECTEEVIGNRVYCSLKCRNYYVNKYLRNYSTTVNTFKNKKEAKILEYNKSPNLCNICKSVLSYDKRNAKLCSKECFKVNVSLNNPSRNLDSNKRYEVNRKIQKSIEKNRIERLKSNEYTKVCIYCNTQFTATRKTAKGCSLDCFNTYRKKQSLANKSKRLIYRQMAAFRFGLNSYHDEFDFNLIKKYGWYQPKNHGDNLKGISRDHIFSVNDGFKLMVNPLILAHPANCNLLRHNENNSKNSKSLITLDELLTKINEWNIKYNEDFSIDKIYITDDELINIAFKIKSRRIYN
jgi:hypothetical protein